MNRESFLDRIQRIPVPLLPTMVGAATLSNVYGGLTFTWVRHITMLAATVVLLIYVLKILKHPKVCLGEYSNTVPASLYAGFTMLMMILGSYYFEYSEVFGKVLWYAGVILHSIHILIFTIKNVITTRNKDTFVPSWFVTYNGLLVSCVVGGAIGNATLLKVIAYYGIIIYAILMPIMIWRLLTHEIKVGMYHTQAIVLAPCSLCVVAYLNVETNPNFLLLSTLYICVILSLLFILYKLPKFFSYKFTPAFAGLTFPMAIGIVSSTKMAGYLLTNGYEDLAEIVRQVSGLQMYITTAIIAFVVFNFLKMLQKTNEE